MAYNLLTLQLLYEGYTVENYPDFVQIDTSRLPGKNPLRNLGGGFVYKSDYLRSMIFKTPCGFYVCGENVLKNMFYYIAWIPENNNPVIRCPFARGDFSCDKQHPLLQNKREDSGIIIMKFCSCSQTKEDYVYDMSIEKVRRDRNAEIEQKYQEFVKSKNGHVCRNHAVFNEYDAQWHLKYDPEHCAYSCYSSFCPIRGRELNKKKANVYYDLFMKGVYEEGLIRQEWERVRKGVRYFKKPVSRDICDDFIKLRSDVILNKYKLNHGREFMADPSLVVEVRNIRAESRPRRDLEQDLLDIKEGRFISWEPDAEKKQLEEKRLRRQLAQEKRISRLEKKIVRSGIESLDTAERIRVKKLISPERIIQLEKEREELRQRPVLEQVNLLEIIE